MTLQSGFWIRGGILSIHGEEQGTVQRCVRDAWEQGHRTQATPGPGSLWVAKGGNDPEGNNGYSPAQMPVMEFPESPRVKYARQPLVEVVAQVRFPPILRVDAAPPAEFQDRIRKTFPILQESEQFPPGLPREIQNLLQKTTANAGPKRWTFAAENGHDQVVLTRDFLAVVTGPNYSRWEEFTPLIDLALDALVRSYSPAFFSRVGLRYQDLLRRSALELSQASWKGLLNPAVAGPLDSIDGVSGFQATTLFDLPTAIKVRQRFEIVTRVDDPGEQALLIDADFFSDQRTEVNDAHTRFNLLHDGAGRLFRWVISKDVHERLRPEPIA